MKWILVFVILLIGCSKEDYQLPPEQLDVQVVTTGEWLRFFIIERGNRSIDTTVYSGAFFATYPPIYKDSFAVVIWSEGYNVTIRSRVILNNVLKSDCTITGNDPRMIQWIRAK